MNSKELNSILISNFVDLKDLYIEEISWQDGNETGSHIIFGDIFRPYIEKNIIIKDKDKLKHIFIFIEKLLELNDNYVEEVIAFSVIEGLEKKLSCCIEFMGNKTLTIFNEISKYYRR